MSTDPLDPEQPVFTAADLLAYQRARGRLPNIAPPRAVLLTFQGHLTKYVAGKHTTRQVKLFNADLHLLKRGNYELALVSGFGSGSSATAALVDQLAAFGVRQFIAIGLAGGLQADQKLGHLVISKGAIRDEGVSRHYLPPSETVESSSEMAEGVAAILANQNRSYSSGLTWTTDAPFREIRRDVLAHQSNGVLAVDMEAAAIFAVAQANGLSALAVFSIADTLANGVWSMSEDLRPAQMGLTVLFDAVFEYLSAP